jgi:hypothetical protein
MLFPKVFPIYLKVDRCKNEGENLGVEPKWVFLIET